jgi:hypothetical protein
MEETRMTRVTYEECFFETNKGGAFADAIKKYASEGWDRVYTQINDAPGNEGYNPYTAYYAIFRRELQPKPTPCACPEAAQAEPQAASIPCLYVGCDETAEPDGEYCAAHQLEEEELARLLAQEAAVSDG